ncbi:MAG: DUF4147 domain-containing protein [Polyangiaceae bacterium]
MTAALLRERLTRAFEEARRSYDLAHLVYANLPAPPERVQLIAAGKSAPEMAKGALERWGEAIELALVVAPHDTPCDLDDPRIELLRASHPVPDETSVAAARRALEVARGSAPAHLLVLVSGGASSLLCAPHDVISLADKIAVTRALLLSGASIAEVNTVRRHLSRIKGGGLARAAHPAVTSTFLVSDVIDGAAHDVGSGPALPDPTTVEDARKILWRYAPAHGTMPLVESLKTTEPAGRGIVKTLVSPGDFASATASRLDVNGLRVRVLPPSIASVAMLVAEYTLLAKSLAPGEVVVRSAEPALSVDVGNPGRGGRAGHLAALVARHLPPDVVFLAGASDGVDGSSDASGAVVDADFVATVGPRYAALVAAFDTATAHELAGTALPGGPTGLNLADVHILARA